MRRQESFHSEEDRPTTICKHCRKPIITTNYLIHQARCQMLQSRASNTQIKPQIRPTHSQMVSELESSQQPNSSNVYRYPKIEEPKKRIFNSRVNQNKQQQIEKIPCPFCGYKQTLAELDTHPSQCEHREQECPGCHSCYPKSLMEDHRYACPAFRAQRQHEERILQQQRQREQERQYQEQHIHGINPLMNFFENGFRVRSQPSREVEPEMYQNQYRPAPGVRVYQFSDGRGRNRIVINQGGRNSNQEGFQNAFFDSNSLFNSFNDLIRVFVQRQNSQSPEQGLSAQQIKEIPIVKYKQEKEEKELCTICYCDFQEGENVMVLKCKHMYHPECIKTWLQKNCLCPVCKQPTKENYVSSADRNQRQRQRDQRYQQQYQQSNQHRQNIF